LPAETFLEGRVVFPKSMVPSATRTSGMASLNSILAQEEQWAEEANRTRKIQRALLPISIACLIACAVSAITLQLRWGKEYRPEFSGDYYRELPGDYTPAELGYLWNFKKIGSQDIAATILDLARKGFLRIEVSTEEKEVLGGILGTKTVTDYVLVLEEKGTAVLEDPKVEPGLTEHERFLLEYLFRTASGGKSALPLKRLETVGNNSPASINKFFQGFKERVESTPAALQMFDHKTDEIRIREIIAGSIVFGSGLIALSITRSIALPVILICAGGLILIFSGTFLRRRSQTGSTHMEMWKAFRRFLEDFSALDMAEIPSLVIWEHYLVYATVLGIADKVIEQLAVLYPEAGQPATSPFTGWAWFSGGQSTAKSFAETLHSVTRSLQN